MRAGEGKGVRAGEGKSVGGGFLGRVECHNEERMPRGGKGSGRTQSGIQAVGVFGVEGGAVCVSHHAPVTKASHPATSQCHAEVSGGSALLAQLFLAPGEATGDSGP